MVEQYGYGAMNYSRVYKDRVGYTDGQSEIHLENILVYHKSIWYIDIQLCFIGGI